jgi:hypothetical protein
MALVVSVCSYTQESTTNYTSFYINLPIGGLSAIIIVLFFTSPESSRYEEPVTTKEMILHMDLPGALVLLGAVFCYLLALQWGGINKPWNSSQVYGTLLGFGLLMVAFLAVEWRQGDHAMCAPHLLKRRVVWVGCVFSFL